MEPDTRALLPSEDLAWQDLDHALLVVVVAPDYAVRLYAEDTRAYPAHAAMLRDLANRLDQAGEPA